MADPKLRVDPGGRPSGSGPQRNRRAAAPARRRAKRGGGRGFFRGLFKLGLLLFLWGVILGGGALAYFALTLPDTNQLTVAERRPSVTVLAEDGSIIATFGDLFGQPLTLREMSPWLPKAVIATEDRRFYSHFGIDPIGLARAIFADLRSGHLVQGGSTITQQLAKTVFLSPERSLSRKIREALLALWLERHFTKDQILEIYLNRVYLGAGTYGVDAAAHRYFNKSASKLNLYESAVIAGLLKAPTRFNPTHDKEKAAARAAQVLDLMVETGAIDQQQALAAEKSGAGLRSVAVARPGTRYFADWVADQVRDFAGTADHDLIVRTTLDPRMQSAAETAIADVLARHGIKDVVSQGALVAMATDGAIRAMVGGRDYNESQFNRATQAQRQPGSAFKPFVYLAGLEAGIRPEDRFIDQPIQIGNWRPRNYTNRYIGEVSAAEALAESINTVAVQVAQRAGIPNVIAVANRLGITSNLARDPSIALGTNEVSLLELVSAYAPFANGGNGVLAYGIVEIRDTDGKIIYRRTGNGPGQVIPGDEVGMMNEMLAGVISHGTGRAAALPRPVAGKTGTTQEYRDAWFIGYTADLVAGIWLGNDDNTAMNRVTGGSLPAPVWRAFMQAAIQGMPVKPLPTGVPQQAAGATPVMATPQPAPGQSFGYLTAPTTATATTTAIPLSPGTVVPAPPRN